MNHRAAPPFIEELGVSNRISSRRRIGSVSRIMVKIVCGLIACTALACAGEDQASPEPDPKSSAPLRIGYSGSPPNWLMALATCSVSECCC